MSFANVSSVLPSLATTISKRGYDTIDIDRIDSTIPADSLNAGTTIDTGGAKSEVSMSSTRPKSSWRRWRRNTRADPAARANSHTWRATKYAQTTNEKP